MKRCLRDLKLREVAALVRDATDVLAQLQVPSDMHHVAWQTLAAELKTRVDTLLRDLVAVASDCAEVRVCTRVRLSTQWPSRRSQASCGGS